MELACAFPPGLATPEHVAAAERIGYTHAWIYDSPALYHDVWVTLARSAERTSTIGLGPGVMVPSLRHVMASAAAIATLADLAPGRVSVAIGSGFTGARCLGRAPMRWSEVTAYVRALKALLAGEEIDWEGKRIAMLQPDGFGAPRPVSVPILIAAAGPKGFAAAKELADGVFLAGDPTGADQFDHASLLMFGTVRRGEEDVAGPRTRAAAGPGAAVVLHGMYERDPSLVEMFPNGAAWRASVEQQPQQRRHLAVHDGHLVQLNQHDEVGMSPELLSGFVFEPAALRERLAMLGAGGVTQVAYQPCGPDVVGELETFHAAATGS